MARATGILFYFMEKEIARYHGKENIEVVLLISHLDDTPCIQITDWRNDKKEIIMLGFRNLELARAYFAEMVATIQAAENRNEK
jgi:hypothetical protein